MPGPLGDQILGAADAPVTIVEYASMTCPHCASFHETTYPDMKKKYVDTGKVRFIFREFPLDPLAAARLDAGALRRQRQILSADRDAVRTAEGLGGAEAAGAVVRHRQAGRLYPAELRRMSGESADAQRHRRSNRAASKFNVTSTPTFFINGKLVRGTLTMEELDKQVAPYLKG